MPFQLLFLSLAKKASHLNKIKVEIEISASVGKLVSPSALFNFLKRVTWLQFSVPLAI